MKDRLRQLLEDLRQKLQSAFGPEPVPVPVRVRDQRRRR